jgi:ribonuclease Z
VSSVALRLPQRGEVWLFDCGEGTQHQILRSQLNISQITRIFITHMHGDHLFGLMGLLATCGMSGHARGIEVYGPRGIEQYVRECGERTQTHYSYPLAVHTVAAGQIFEDEEFTVSCAPLKHRVASFGYRVTEKDRPGRFDVEKARAMGIPSGPLYGKLKRGESVRLADGREVGGADFCGPTEVGRSVVYCTDTIYCDGAIELSRGADVLIHEATFAQADEELARRSLHSTATMAARVAREADVKSLLITHLSPRYAEGNQSDAGDLLREARAVFPQTHLAYDFLTIEVPRRE